MKNWLIRTKSNHLLGPISRDKLLELIQAGTIRPEDEVCSANGFWIYVRETELVRRHVFEQVPQTFNPITEAKTVLKNKKLEGDVNPEGQVIEALSVPEIGTQNPKIPPVAVKFPSDEDLEEPELPTQETERMLELKESARVQDSGMDKNTQNLQLDKQHDKEISDNHTEKMKDPQTQVQKTPAPVAAKSFSQKKTLLVPKSVIRSAPSKNRINRWGILAVVTFFLLIGFYVAFELLIKGSFAQEDVSLKKKASREFFIKEMILN
jgi:hypothetical protein